MQLKVKVPAIVLSCVLHIDMNTMKIEWQMHVFSVYKGVPNDTFAM